MEGVLIVLEEFLDCREFHFRKPRVFFGRVSFPTDKILPMGWSSFVMNDLLDFIVFFVINEIRWGRREVPSMYFIFEIRT